MSQRAKYDRVLRVLDHIHGSPLEATLLRRHGFTLNEERTLLSQAGRRIWERYTRFCTDDSAIEPVINTINREGAYMAIAALFADIARLEQKHDAVPGMTRHSFAGHIFSFNTIDTIVVYEPTRKISAAHKHVVFRVENGEYVTVMGLRSWLPQIVEHAQQLIEKKNSSLTIPNRLMIYAPVSSN